MLHEYPDISVELDVSYGFVDIVENRYSTRCQPSPAFQLVLEALCLP